MPDDILAYQAGRETAMAGERRDGRRSADWLAGYDSVKMVQS